MAQRRRIVETVEVALDQLHKDSVAKQLTFSYRVGRQIKNIRLTDLVYITTTASQALDYIVKGADPMAQRRRIVETVEVALDQLHKDSVAKQLTFSYRVGRQIKNIRLTDLVYITTTLTPHKLLIVKQAGEAQFLGSLSQCAKENPLLEKISQSCLVNPDNIEAIDLRHHLVSFVNGDVEEYAAGRQKQMKTLMQEHDYRLAKLMKS
jgi:two-component system, LytTR family, response regulator AgrA